MISINITGGRDKNGQLENINTLTFHSGMVYSIVGKTGSGKSQLIEDIESLSKGDGVTKRSVELNSSDNQSISIAHLSQNMNFILDLRVKDFINKRINLTGKSNIHYHTVIDCANELCGEKLTETDILTQLSGGQSRALMIADIALTSLAEIILIDEIENAGINKLKAIELLLSKNKLVLVITHDPLLALYGNQRIVMKNGGISNVLCRTKIEEEMITKLYQQHLEMENIRSAIRNGQSLQLIN